ncbi:MAG TPA: MerR family transcriptional regulator [Thermoanaerobaculia bacterium]|nr:MerR family transcriptional regulator [Thermoanaerobaculia bacterium]
MAEVNGSGGETRYKIGDVCRIADVQPYVLRYWESEFPVLAPDKSIPGPRTYSARELKLIEQIKRLLYDEGYTIAGAKKRLESESGGRAESKDAGADTNPAIVPIPSAPKPPKVEKPRPPRPPKAAVPAITDASSELPPPEVTQPVDVPAAAPGAPVDDRVPRAVAELKQILALLSRSEP